MANKLNLNPTKSFFLNYPIQIKSTTDTNNTET